MVDNSRVCAAGKSDRLMGVCVHAMAELRHDTWPLVAARRNAGGLSYDGPVLKNGWTPERAGSFYGGISESKMRSMVAYARRHGFLK
jgi:hypothetical protein